MESNGVGLYVPTTLNIPISEGGTNSNHVHNLAKSQLPRVESFTEWHKIHEYMLIDHRFL